MSINNYYIGFEGEPEIKILNQKGAELLSSWEGYIDSILQQIPPTEKGWVNLAYYYNLHEGWYETSPWKIPDIIGALEQLSEIKKEDLDTISSLVLDKILDILKNAADGHYDIYIAYE